VQSLPTPACRCLAPPRGLPNSLGTAAASTRATAAISKRMVTFITGTSSGAAGGAAAAAAGAYRLATRHRCYLTCASNRRDGGAG